MGPLLSDSSTSKTAVSGKWGKGSKEDRLTETGASLAASPDGKTLYATGYRECTGRRMPDRGTHVVYSFGGKDDQAKIFIGELYQPGAGEEHLNTPIGIATDKAGNVYVADRENNRVAVFEPDGSYLGELPFDRPDRVEVHPGSGAVYVLGGQRINELKKFTSWEDKAPAYQCTLPCGPQKKKESDPKRTASVMALDASAEPAVLRFSAPARGSCRYRLLRMEDGGTAFGEPEDIDKALTKHAPSVDSVMSMTVDRSRERVYATWRMVKYRNVTVWDGRTGRLFEDVKIPPRLSCGSIETMGLDGNFYAVRCGVRGWRRHMKSPSVSPVSPVGRSVRRRSAGSSSR
jgi:DNA-binding beta-propeller fold protein YncE